MPAALSVTMATGKKKNVSRGKTRKKEEERVPSMTAFPFFFSFRVLALASTAALVPFSSPRMKSSMSPLGHSSDEAEKRAWSKARESESERRNLLLCFFFPSRFFSMPLPLNAFFPLLLGTSFFSLPGPRCSLCHFESLVVDFLDKLTIAEALGSFQRERKKRVMFPSKHRSRRSLFFHSFKTHLSPSLFLSSCSLSLNHQFKIEPFKHPVTMDPSYGGECFCCFRKRERKEEKDEGWSTKKKTQPLPTSSLPSSKKKQKKTPQQRKPGRSSRTRSTRSTTTTRPG